MDTFRYEKEIPSLGHYDVCVVGGGMRCMPAAFAIGQAAGVACALACEVDADVRRVDISRLQSILRECGAILD